MQYKLTSNSCVEPVEIGERQRHRAKMHHYFVHISHVAGAAMCHEDAGVATSNVTAAGIVHGKIDGGVQGAFDRSLDARVEQLSVSQLLDFSCKDVIRLAHLSKKRCVVLNCRR